MNKNRSEVIVIGAGIAGLMAAADLADAGLHVTLIEARDRIGGRIYTFHDDSYPLPYELGAEFVHGKPPELLAVIDRDELPFCDVTDRHWHLDNGVLKKASEFWEEISDVMRQMDPDAPDRSFQEFIESRHQDAEFRQIKAALLTYIEGFHAARPELIGIHGLIKANEAEEAIEGERSFRVLTGYDSVVQCLAEVAKQKGANCYLNTRVKEIRWQTNRVEIVCFCENEKLSLTAEAAVITLPLAVLKARPEVLSAVRFVPELPEEKQRAIQKLEVGQVVKLVIRFRSRFWETRRLQHDFSDLGFVHSPESAFPTWWTMLPVRAPVLVAWVGGPDAEALVKRDQKFIEDQAIRSLSTIVGMDTDQIRAEVEALYFHNWHADQFSLGAYSYVPVNGLSSQEVMSKPVNGTLYFAGEALSVGHIGTVHGALMTGQRAAQELLEDN
jgi:monoamine oxidase